MQLVRHKICSKFCFICSDIRLQNQRLIIFWCWTFKAKRLLSLYEVWAAARFNISEGCCPAGCQCLQTAELVKTSWMPDTELLQGFLRTAWSAIYSALPMRSDREETGEILMRLERVASRVTRKSKVKLQPYYQLLNTVQHIWPQMFQCCV